MSLNNLQHLDKKQQRFLLIRLTSEVPGLSSQVRWWHQTVPISPMHLGASGNPTRSDWLARRLFSYFPLLVLKGIEFTTGLLFFFQGTYSQSEELTKTTVQSETCPLPLWDKRNWACFSWAGWHVIASVYFLITAHKSCPNAHCGS